MQVRHTNTVAVMQAICPLNLIDNEESRSSTTIKFWTKVKGNVDIVEYLEEMDSLFLLLLEQLCDSILYILAC